MNQQHKCEARYLLLITPALMQNDVKRKLEQVVLHHCFKTDLCHHLSVSLCGMEQLVTGVMKAAG